MSWDGSATQNKNERVAEPSRQIVEVACPPPQSKSRGG